MQEGKEVKKISVSLTYDQWIDILILLTEQIEKYKTEIEFSEKMMKECSAESFEDWKDLLRYYEEKRKNEIKTMEEIRKQMKGKI